MRLAKPVRSLSKYLQDPRVRMAAAAGSVHAASVIKRWMKKRLRKGKSKALRHALASLVDTLQEAATNSLVGSKDGLLEAEETRREKDRGARETKSGEMRSRRKGRAPARQPLRRTADEGGRARARR
jgi:hypothetical protein